MLQNSAFGCQRKSSAVRLLDLRRLFPLGLLRLLELYAYLRQASLRFREPACSAVPKAKREFETRPKGPSSTSARAAAFVIKISSQT